MKSRLSAGGICGAGLLLVLGARADAQTLPEKFQETIVISGLTAPTTLRFSADGRVFVAEKSGLIKVFDGLDDKTPTIFADLRTNVHNFWDRGLLGLALHPDFPATPYVYVLYAHDATIGGAAPKWGTAGQTSDACPDPPGANKRPGGCVVSGRLSRLRANGDRAQGEEVLLEDWFQQYPSHSTGALAFGADGYLYASSGDGASFSAVDWGQYGSPGEPAEVFPDDPPGEGGALRTQDLYRPGDATGLNGSIIRVDPVTGGAAPDNPLFGAADANAARIVAYGLRNPFRFAVRPGTNELWVGDVGWQVWEEINVVTDPTAGPLNFGWPCYEGIGHQPGYDAADLSLCEALYLDTSARPDTARAPWFSYEHKKPLLPDDGCGSGGSSIAGVAFYESGDYPASYDGALFFADFSRKCIWVAFLGDGGDPDPQSFAPFVSGAAGPIDLQIGPTGDVFYVDIGGTVRQIEYFVANRPPTAVLVAGPTGGPAPLTVSFDASSSSDPDPGDTLSYEWDLDGDGEFDDSTAAKASYTYSAPGDVTVRLRVSDPQHVTGVASRVIAVANTPPAASIDSPAAVSLWRANQTVTFSGSATDAQDGALPEAALDWTLELHHCPEDCHVHEIESWEGVAGGSFLGPEHEHPTHLVLVLKATDSGGLSDTRRLELQPETAEITLQSEPSGLSLGLGPDAEVAPFSQTVIAGTNQSLAASSPQVVDDKTYTFVSWSDGGAAAHDVTVGEDTRLVATFAVTSDLSVAVLAATAAVPGLPLHLDVQVTNNGPSPLEELTLDYTPPATLLEPSFAPSAGELDPSSGAWSGLTLAVDTSVTLRIEGTLSAAASETMEHLAQIASPGVVDPDDTNDRASASTQLTPGSDLALSMALALDVVETGQRLSYELSVHNAGPSDAAEVEVRNSLPAGVTLVDISGEGWTCGTAVELPSVLSCVRSTLPAGERSTITATVDAPSTPGPVTSHAEVRANTGDPTPDNNLASATLSVAAPSTEPPDDSPQKTGGGCTIGGSPRTRDVIHLGLLALLIALAPSRARRQREPYHRKVCPRL